MVPHYNGGILEPRVEEVTQLQSAPFSFRNEVEFSAERDAPGPSTEELLVMYQNPGSCQDYHAVFRQMEAPPAPPMFPLTLEQDVSYHLVRRSWAARVRLLYQRMYGARADVKLEFGQAVPQLSTTVGVEIENFFPTALNLRAGGDPRPTIQGSEDETTRATPPALESNRRRPRILKVCHSQSSTGVEAPRGLLPDVVIPSGVMQVPPVDQPAAGLDLERAVSSNGSASSVQTIVPMEQTPAATTNEMRLRQMYDELGEIMARDDLTPEYADIFRNLPLCPRRRLDNDSFVEEFRWRAAVNNWTQTVTDQFQELYERSEKHWRDYYHRVKLNLTLEKRLKEHCERLETRVTDLSAQVENAQNEIGQAMRIRTDELVRRNRTLCGIGRGRP